MAVIVGRAAAGSFIRRALLTAPPALCRHLDTCLVLVLARVLATRVSGSAAGDMMWRAMEWDSVTRSGTRVFGIPV